MKTDVEIKDWEAYAKELEEYINDLQADMAELNAEKENIEALFPCSLPDRKKNVH